MDLRDASHPSIALALLVFHHAREAARVMATVGVLRIQDAVLAFAQIRNGSLDAVSVVNLIFRPCIAHTRR
jgi:hypothetical protein